MEFSKWRQRLWPIHRFELKKIIPLLLMKFFISFIYGILTCLKDTLVVTEKASGAEVIPVLKGWVVLPVAIGAMLLYSKFSNIFKRSSLFYGVVLTFMGFILLYGLYLYPNKEALSPIVSSNWLIETLGAKYSHWVAIYRYWMHSLFFVIAELWGSIGILLLFWGFANQVSQLGEAKRYYTLFIAGGDIATFLTGPLVWHYAQKYALQNFSLTLQSLTFYIMAFGGIVMALYWWFNRYVMSDPKLYDKEACQPQGEKTKLSLLQSIKYIASSKYLRYLAIMVIGYGLAINLVEVTWKAHLKLLYPNPADYQAFMGKVTSAVGITSFLIAIFLGGGVIRFFGWRFSAMITPIVLGVTGLGFLFLVLGKNLASPYAWLGLSPLLFIVVFGAFQSISSKVVKYTFFDPTKEMAFIPLDQEAKVKGKAAIDVVGSRLGKSGSSWIQVLLMGIVGSSSVLSITSFLIPIIAFMVFRWIFAVRSLSKEFAVRSEEKKLSAEESPSSL